MQKTVIKTAIITVIAILLAVVVTFAGFSLFAPAKTGDFLSEMGLEGSALNHYAIAYSRNKSTSNLVKVINSAVILEDEDELIKYFGDLEERQNEVEEEYFLTVAGKYCIILAKQNQTQNAINKALTYSQNYTESCLLRALIYHALSTENKQFGGEVYNALVTLKQEKYQEMSSESKTLLDADIAILSEYLNK